MKEKDKRYLEMKPLDPNRRRLENIWKYKELRKNIIRTICLGIIIGSIIGIIVSIPISNIMKEKETSVPIYEQYKKFTGAETFIYKNEELNVTIEKYYDSYIENWWYKAVIDIPSRNSAWNAAGTPNELYLEIRDYYLDEMTEDQLKWFDYMLHNVVK